MKRFVTQFERMVEYDDSQLPVADVIGKPIGMLTSAAIMRALNNFATTTGGLPV
jgi:predicted transcriptional regulator